MRNLLFGFLCVIMVFVSLIQGKTVEGLLWLVLLSLNSHDSSLDIIDMRLRLLEMRKEERK